MCPKGAQHVSEPGTVRCADTEGAFMTEEVFILTDPQKHEECHAMQGHVEKHRGRLGGRGVGQGSGSLSWGFMGREGRQGAEAQSWLI